MNVALLSNSLINRTLAFNISYVLDREIDNIFLPAENHSQDEIFFSGREKIHISNDIDDIVSKSDIIIVANNNCSNRFQKSKRTIFINNPWANETESTQGEEDFQNLSSKPVIAILSLGRFTDQYYTEILVNKILQENGAKIYQIYSDETFSILSELLVQDMLNESLINVKIEEADVIVVSLDGTKFHNDAEFVCELNRISPDILFVCIDKTIEKIDNINNIAEIVRKINLTVRSPYASYDVGTGVKYPIYCGISEDGFGVSSLDTELESYFRELIMKTLYFPTGIIFL